MNNFVTKAALFFCVVVIAIGVTSCESEYSKENNELIQKYSDALTENNLDESRRLSDILESRELNSKQTETARRLNINLRQLEKEEAQRKYDEAMRKAKEIETWLVNSIDEYEQLLKKQRDAETLKEYTDLEKQLVAMEKKAEDKAREREHYLDEARSWQKKLNNY